MHRLVLITSIIYFMCMVAAEGESGYQSNISKPLKIGVPSIAHVGNITIGTSTIESLDRTFGHGLAVTGGHPYGAREWILKQTGWYFYADGFDYSNSGRIVSSFEVGIPGTAEKRAAPQISASLKSLAFLSAITLGTSRNDVNRILKARKLKFASSGNVETSIMSGYNPVNKEIIYTKWIAKLYFRRKHLSCIRLDCE